MRKLPIKSSEWLRGNKPSYLCRESDGLKCCMGIDAVDRGISVGLIIGKALPWTIRDKGKTNPTIQQYVEDWEEGYEVTIINDSTFWWQLYSAGIDQGFGKEDQAVITDEERIELLRPYFAKRGIELEFLPNA